MGPRALWFGRPLRADIAENDELQRGRRGLDRGRGAVTVAVVCGGGEGGPSGGGQGTAIGVVCDILIF